jgi:hypothetical protein
MPHYPGHLREAFVDWLEPAARRTPSSTTSPTGPRCSGASYRPLRPCLDRREERRRQLAGAAGDPARSGRPYAVCRIAA